VLLALRWGFGRLPQGVRRGHVLAAGAVAGIPFTVSLFVAELALPPRLVEPATVAIILAAAVTGLLGFLLVRRIGGSADPPPDPVPPQVS
jgi:Na+/H+ antiporter NhaA